MGIGNIADTGMNSALTDMEVISNNIANANTFGFKKSTVNFSDIYPAGSGDSPGLGVRIDNIAQDFSSGGTELTKMNTDFSISNNCFFVIRDPSTSQIAYTRYGRYTLQPDGYLTFNGKRLQGFPAINGAISTSGNLTDLQINQNAIPAKSTSSISIKNMNLNSSANVPTTTPFNASDPTSFNFKNNATIYDSLGNAHSATMYYCKTASNAWNVNVDIDGTVVGTGTASFNADGTLASTTGLNSLSFTTTSGATSPQAFSIDLTGSTQFSIDNKEGTIAQDGYQAGTFTNFQFDNSGNLVLQYSNNKNILGGQIALAAFQSPEGLQNLGNMSWTATADSGSANVSQSNSIGKINAGSLENSNVDITTEMVHLINAQHNFQANAQVEQTYNDVMQTVIKL